MSPYSLQILLQILDGILTYIGIWHFEAGIELEANPILRYLMGYLGAGFALFLVKFFAILAVRALKRVENYQSVIVKRSLFVINLIYTFIVLQWIYCLIKYW